MAENVQSLLLRVDATTELLRRELAKAAAETDQWAERTKKGADRAGAAIDGTSKNFLGLSKAADFAKGAIGGLLGSLSIGAVVSIGRATLEFADNLDAAAEQAGLSAERYQTLREGLRSLEVDGEKADNIFKRLQDTLGAVQGGTAAGGVTDALDKMGITSRILNGEIDSTASLFDAIAGSAGKFKTQAEFVAAVVDVVGRKLGVELATAIKDGGKALKEQEAAFKATGAVISDDYVKRLADANEAIDAFTSRQKGKLAIWAAESIGEWDAVTAAVGRYVAANGGILNTPLLGIVKTAANASDAAVVARNFAARFPDDYGAKPAPKQTFSPPKKSAAKSGGGSATSKPKAPALTASENRMGFGEKLGDVPSLAPSVGSDPAIANLDAIAGRLNTIKSLAQTIPPINPIDTTAVELAGKFSDNLSRGLGQAIIYGQSLGDALVSSIKAAAAELISSQLLTLLNGSGGDGGFVSSLIKGAATILGGRAAGGPVDAGTPYIVGEHRPEIFVPSTRGKIVSRVDGMGGGSVINVDARGATDPAMIEAAARRGAQQGIATAAQAFGKSQRQSIPRGRV